LKYVKKIFKNIRALVPFKDLIIELSKRDFLQRYKGSYLGFIWALLNPLVMLSVYSFIFIAVFKSRWGEVGIDSNATYTLMIFSGLVPFYVFSESVNRSLTILVNNSNYIKKVVIPVEVLPISLVVSTTIRERLLICVNLKNDKNFICKLLWGKIPIVIFIFLVILDNKEV